MTVINEVAQSLQPDALVNLFSIDLSSLGGGIEYFVAGADHGEAVLFDGQSYTPIDVEATGFEMSGVGGLPIPRLRIANREGFVQVMLETHGDITGCKLSRTRTFARFLDNGTEPDPSAIYGPDRFTIEQKTAENAIFIEWTLSASFDQAGKMLPGRQVVRDTCLWRYRHWNGTFFDYTNTQCPYTGATSFDEDNAVTTPDLDRCSRRLSSCKARFGSDQVLPFGGFPGVARVRG